MLWGGITPWMESEEVDEEDENEPVEESLQEEADQIEETPVEDAEDTTDNEQVELTEVEVVESTPSVASNVDALSTFSETEGPFSYKVIPVVSGRSTNWRVVVYMQGVQGPVYESEQQISDEAADQMGMSRRLQDRINEAVRYANAELEIPAELGKQKRSKRSLHELEVLMDEDHK